MMPAPAGSEYLPRTRARLAVRRMMAAAAYRVWRRKLVRKAGFLPLDKRVFLELGSGPGFFLARLRAWFPESTVIGSDIHPDCARRAADEAPGAAPLRSDALEIPIRGGALDLVSAFQVVEHVASPERFLEEARRILKPGGILLLSTPNPAGIGARLRKTKWQGIRHDHVSLRPPADWAAAVRSAGFLVLDQGTTGLTGIPVLKVPPLSLLNWIPMVLFGYFPWRSGESLMMMCSKDERA